jgi:hypothetical protein
MVEQYKVRRPIALQTDAAWSASPRPATSSSAIRTSAVPHSMTFEAMARSEQLRALCDRLQHSQWEKRRVPWRLFATWPVRR